MVSCVSLFLEVELLKQCRCVWNFNGYKYGRDCQWIQMKVPLLGLIIFYRFTLVTVGVPQRDFSNFYISPPLFIQYDKQYNPPSWKSSYNSPSEDLELPLWERGEWWFYHPWYSRQNSITWPCSLTLQLQLPTY